MGSHPTKTLAKPGRGQKSSCRRVLYFVVTVGTAWEGSAPVMVPACWDLCEVAVRDSHCPEEHVALISGRRNEPATEVAAVMGGWGRAWKRM